MSRPWQIWLTFAGCLIVAVTAVGWLGVKALQADKARENAQHEAVVEENARLALWRMDSFMTPIMAEENARPWSMYGSSNGQMLKNKFDAESVDAVLSGDQSARYVLLHFQFTAGGHLTSFELPKNSQLGKNASAKVDQGPSQQHLAEVLADLQNSLDYDALAAELILPEYADPPLGTTESKPEQSKFVENENANQTIEPQPEDLPQQPQINSQAQIAVPQQQSLRSQAEFQARSKSLAQSNNSAQNIGFNNSLINSPDTGSLKSSVAHTSKVVASMLKPLWIGGKLLLVRRVMIGNQEYGQGCLLDWEMLKSALLKEVSDLLPSAELQPIKDSKEDSESHRLASLPVMLIPGELADVSPAGLSPIKQALLIAGGALAVVVLAGAALLAAVIALSERRAAFVSAVTHELRTPLTTFRMYAEMLSEGMITNEADRRHYLETLCVEADRLTHLVANVLAYARLERGSSAGRIETLNVEKLLAMATQRLSDRATQAKLQLVIEPVGNVLTDTVCADPAAVEQILFNLVDNACKYVASASDRTLHLSAKRKVDRIEIRVSDHGPGISTDERRRLFRPFHKSAKEAAHSVPGVGLGLALSRRLALDMHGNLRYEALSSGASFVLSLPAVG